MEIKGMAAIVTGGSKGYGYGIASALKKAGAQVWITGRDAKALKSAAETLGVNAVQADVASAKDWDNLFAQVTAKTGGRLDILVNNAGAGVAIAPVVEQTDEAIISSININLTGTILGCRRAGRIMSGQKSGIIINISSVCALYAWPAWSVYSAAKAGLNKFGHGLYTELRPFGVRVTTITPSWGATEFGSAANLGTRDEAAAKKCMQPEEMGKLVVDICTMPDHLAVPDITVQPLVQEIVPM
ncbi:MAG: SDR family oxidoreductase [Spirochaetes bacterium]|nr:SDR family oxidoreductase [Spirochaetota bacterium]